MEVTRYLFQSPYSSQVQVGRPETSTSSNTSGADTQSNPVANVTSLESKVTQESPKAEPADKLLDTYA
jgi:hypothetical protein